MANLPTEEVAEVLGASLGAAGVRIERIVSPLGHSSPDEGWYDQDEAEWVTVLQGSAGLVYDDGREVVLKEGEYVTIMPHERHRVAWTDKERVTVWLAVFWREGVTGCG